MRNKENEKFELSALLDGEVKDSAQAEKLAQAIAASDELQCEYDEQREIKSLLGSLPEYDAPDFMATRVMGEIAARKRPARNPLLKVIFSTVGGFALLALLFTVSGPLFMADSPTSTDNTMIARPIDGALLVANPAFAPQDWREFSLPEDITDERMREFLEYANEAHAYRVMVSGTETMSPDMGQALLVLDNGGSN